MNGNEDLERQDDHLGKHAALCLVETGVEVAPNDDGIIEVSLKGIIFHIDLTPFQARLLSDALLEAASTAEGNGLKS